MPKERVQKSGKEEGNLSLRSCHHKKSNVSPHSCQFKQSWEHRINPEEKKRNRSVEFETSIRSPRGQTDYPSSTERTMPLLAVGSPGKVSVLVPGGIAHFHRYLTSQLLFAARTCTKLTCHKGSKTVNFGHVNNEFFALEIRDFQMVWSGSNVQIWTRDWSFYWHVKIDSVWSSGCVIGGSNRNIRIRGGSG